MLDKIVVRQALAAGGQQIFELLKLIMQALKSLENAAFGHFTFVFF